MFTCGPNFFYSNTPGGGVIGGGGVTSDLLSLDFAFNGEPFVVLQVSIATEEPADNGEPIFVQG